MSYHNLLNFRRSAGNVNEIRQSYGSNDARMQVFIYL